MSIFLTDTSKSSQPQFTPSSSFSTTIKFFRLCVPLFSPPWKLHFHHPVPAIPNNSFLPTFLYPNIYPASLPSTCFLTLKTNYNRSRTLPANPSRLLSLGRPDARVSSPKFSSVYAAAPSSLYLWPNLIKNFPLAGRSHHPKPIHYSLPALIPAITTLRYSRDISALSKIQPFAAASPLYTLHHTWRTPVAHTRAHTCHRGSDSQKHYR